MAESFIRLPADGGGKKTRSVTTVISGHTVHQSVIKIADKNNDIVNPASDEKLEEIKNLLNVYVDNETPSGVINGSNKTFTTHYYYKPNTTKVFLNGIRQKEGDDYIENGDNEIIFENAPLSGDIIIIDYIKK